MSDSKSQDPDPRSTRQLITALLILLGIVALLPGLCSMVFIRAHASNSLAELGALIACGGIAMIAMGVRRIFAARLDGSAVPLEDERGCRTALLILLAFVVVVAAILAVIFRRLH